VVRAYVRGISGVTYNASAIDDDPLTQFDTINLRNQAQTQQVEFTLTSGASFDLGFETGPTLSESLDGDALPDAWETSQQLSAGDGTGANGDSGNPDFDGYTNREEFILGLNPQAADAYLPTPTKTATGFRVTFATVPNRWYRVFYSDDMVGWDPVTGDILGTGAAQVVDDTTSQTRRFYKVEVRLP
jgi:hypothetical protein